MRNLRIAFRSLARTPYVTVAAVLSLALGIGANTAVFSLLEQLILRPLPVSEPAALVNLFSLGNRQGSISSTDAGTPEHVFSYPMFRDLERAQTPLAGLAGHRLFGANLALRDLSLNGDAMYVSGSYFPLLGIQPAHGRLLGPADDETIGGHPVAVLSHAFWASRLGRDPGIIGETVVVNGQPITIVGVAPPRFEGTTLGALPLLYVPITMRALLTPNQPVRFEDRRQYWVYLFGRLAPGVTLEQAQTALNAIYRPIINDVEAPLQQGLSDSGMARFRAMELTLVPGARGQSSLRAGVRAPLILLFATTGLVLLIACANIANLLLVRGIGRAQEMAVRLSLGASRWQVLTQLLTESLLVALLGGGAGLLLSRWTLLGIAALLPANTAGSLTLELHGTMLIFTAGLAVTTGVLFGLFPALYSTRSDLITALRGAGGPVSGARTASRFRTVLVTAQLALSMALLTSAGLFIRSLMNVTAVDLGLRTASVITFRISPQLSGYTAEQSRALFTRVEESLLAIPGVTHAAASEVPLLTGSNYLSGVRVAGVTFDSDADQSSLFNRVGPGYFAALGIPLLAGRDFTWSDDEAAPNVVIVNEAFVRKFGMGRDVIGRRMSRGGDSLNLEIVGLVKDAKYSEVKQEAVPQFFLPYRQATRIGSLGFYVRSSVQAAATLAAVRSVLTQLDPQLPIQDLKPMTQQVRENVFLERLIGILSAALSVLATLLAAVGLYGVLAYTVAQRTREIGLRMALGASASRVRRMVLGQVARMLSIGAVIGIGAALGLARVSRSLLFGVEGHDPAAFGIAGLLLVLVALCAGYLPALRASRAEPMEALRYQ